MLQNRPLRRYLCAPVSVAIALGVRMLLDPLMGDQFALSTVYSAIVFTAWYGGMVPALLAMVLGYIAGNYLFLPPRGSFSIADTEQLQFLMRYILVGTTTALLGGVMQMMRVRAERSASEVRHQAVLIDQVYDAVLVWDWQGAITFWNRGAEQLYGYSRDEALGKSSHALLDTQAPAGIRAVLQHLDSQGHWEGELQHLTRSDERIWVESRMVLIRDAGSAYVVETNRDVTARKALDNLRNDMQAQLEQQVTQRTAELTRSEQRYRSLIQATAEIVWRSDAHGVPLDSNLTEYTGLTAQQIARGEHLHVAPADSDSSMAAAWREALHSGAAFRHECVLLRAADAAWRDMLISVVPVRNAEDMIEEWMGICVDISRRKQAERALSASEEQTRVLIEGIHGYAILMLDPNGIIQAWSKSAERIGGYSAEEMVGQSFAKLFTRQDLEIEQPAYELAQARTIGKLEIDGWRVRKNGTQFWVNGTIAALRSDDDRLVGYVKVIRDVTEKRRNDELLYSVLDNALDAIVSIDVQGTISLFNRAGEAMFGRTAAEVMGRNIRLLLSDAFQEEYDDYLDSFLQAGSARNLATRREIYGMRKDGDSFPIELAITGFELDQQRYFICILRDISERKKLEEQLRQAQKLEAFGQLAGGVAHDFNNLLMVISGYGSLLQSALQEGSEPHQFVGEIRRAGERAAALTRQLLAFSRQQILEPRVVNLNEIVQDVERMLIRVIGEHVQLSSVLASELSSVRIDPGQMEQVIMNLVMNARDAMPQGGRLTIETSEVAADAVPSKLHPPGRAHSFVTLTISDTGHGMSADISARIFEPFFTTKSVGKGTGLGLAVVHGIIKQSGGSIDVQSEVERGTTFRIYLPAVKELPVVVAESDPVAVVTGDETILLVEDDDEVRELISRSLQAAGYYVLQANNGRHALRVLNECEMRIDLLLTDVVMPEINGSQLAEIFTRRYGESRVLFVSGYANDDLRHGVLRADVAFLQKPFTLGALAIKVREVLNSRQ